MDAEPRAKRDDASLRRAIADSTDEPFVTSWSHWDHEGHGAVESTKPPDLARPDNEFVVPWGGFEHVTINIVDPEAPVLQVGTPPAKASRRRRVGRKEES